MRGTVLLVEDGRTTHVLAAVRSLGRAGWRVLVGGPEPEPLAAASRWCAGVRPVRRPELDLEGFADDVEEVVRTDGVQLVMAGDDVELLALSAVRDRLRPALLPHADHLAVLRSVDKLELVRAARSVGLGAPHTVPATPAAVAAWRGPVVVKPRWHWTPDSAPGSPRALPTVLCDGPEQAAEAVRAVERAGGAAVLQERVDGAQLAVSAVLATDGSLRAVSCQRTVLSSLSRTSCRAETVPATPAVVDPVVALLRALGWSGLANVQLLVGPDGAPRVIDLNGRFYGSLALAVAAGADLPAVWAADAAGDPPAPAAHARPGVRFHSLHADLLRARVQRCGGLLSDVAATLRYTPGAAHPTWSAADLGPARRLAAATAGHAAARLTTRGPARAWPRGGRPS